MAAVNVENDKSIMIATSSIHATRMLLMRIVNSGEFVRMATIWFEIFSAKFFFT